MDRDERLEERIGWILRGGAIASSVLLAAGLLLSFTAMSALAGMLLRAGLVVLFATPITRVAASTIAYAVMRDRLFTILTALVLMELAAAIVAALRG